MFEAEILKRARTTSIAGVCRQLGLHWTTVMRLITHWVQESIDRRFRRKLRLIGVDEVSYGRGQNKYLTIVWDHEAGHVVWIGKGKEEDTLKEFFEKLGPPPGPPPGGGDHGHGPGVHQRRPPTRAPGGPCV